MLLRRPFRLPGHPLVANLLITADDYYKLYVNGRFVGQGPAPGYGFRYNVNAWDVTEFLAAGGNVLAVHVYYQGLVNRVWNSGDYRQGTAAALAAKTADGSVTTIVTDAAWKHRICPAYAGERRVAYDTQFAQDIDARLLPEGWRQAVFDDSHWTPPASRPLTDMDYTFVLQDTPPLEITSVRARSVRPTGEGCYLLDFGEEIVGRFEMRTTGPVGRSVRVRHAEELTEDGRALCPTRCGCDYEDRWTLSGRCDEKFEPFDYKGFRYVEVCGCPTAPDPTTAWAVRRHYPWPSDAARLETSDATLNGIWRICAHGVKLCAQEQFVDCPTREKGQYLNDCLITGHAHMLLTGDARLVRKSLRDFAVSQRIRPGLLAIAPGSLMSEIADASLTWPLQLWEYYLHTGDRDFLAEMLPVAERLAAHYRTYESERGLLVDVRDKWNLVDWPAGMRDGYDFDLDQQTGGAGCQAMLNAYYYACLQTVGRIREALGKPGRVKARLRSLRDAFRRAFFDPERRLFVDAVGSRHSSLHANVMPLCFGMVPEDAVGEVTAYLKRRGMACGVSIAWHLLRVLIDAGEADEAYRLMTADTGRSWQTMLRNGATACMEAWSADQKWNTSFCHAWAAAPVPLLVELFFGLRHGSPGWAKVFVEPRMPESLEWASLELPLPQGRLFARYEREGGVKTLRLRIPAGVEITAPPADANWRSHSARPGAGEYVWQHGRRAAQVSGA